MEKRIDSIVYRRLTYNDFDKINQQGSAYQGQRGGGGQGYIDFPTRNVSIQQWNRLLGNPTSFGAQNRPKWDFKINSIGLNTNEDIRIYQRRSASVIIAAQKLPEHSQGGKRIASWHPNNSFPLNYNPNADDLVIYILKPPYKKRKEFS